MDGGQVTAKTDQNKVKLLYISSDKFPPFRVDVAVLFGKKLKARGYHVDWILQSDKDLEKDRIEHQWWGGKVWVGATDNGASLLSRIRKHLRGLRNDLRVFGIARQTKYDIIQVKDKFLAALFGILAARLYKARFVYWLSYPFPEAYLYQIKSGTARYPLLSLVRGHVFKFLLYRVIMPLSDHVFVQSEQMKKDVSQEGVEEKKLTPVPMGVEIEVIPYVNDSEVDSDKPIIVYLGTLIRIRRMDFLLRAFAVAKRSVPNAILYMVGSGEDAKDIEFLENEARRLNISDSVIFTGFVPMKKAWEYIRMATVCVSPFFPTPILNSTSPTKLVEYMAMGKAVVANDHPEQSLVIAESGAGIYVPYEETAFGEAIARLLKDRELASRMGKKGRAYVESNRSYDVIADRVEAEYRRMLV